MRAGLIAVLSVLASACGDGGGAIDGGGGRGGDGSAGQGDGGGGAGGNGAACGELTATMRDFKADHPDMEAAIGALQGIVEADLGSDDKPVYAPAGATAVTAGKQFFDQWYRDVDGVNLRFEIPIPLAEVSPGVFVFEDNDFFPLDGMGWPGEEQLGHNFHFTTEIHGTFEYRGGEQFTFQGDDDVFVFVNRRLALDLGGVHGVQTGTIDFDDRAADLVIAPGNVYQLDVFHAERHTSQSNFRIETSIDCLVIK